jgi:hypothetical protein
MDSSDSTAPPERCQAVEPSAQGLTVLVNPKDPSLEYVPSKQNLVLS